MINIGKSSQYYRQKKHPAKDILEHTDLAFNYLLDSTISLFYLSLKLTYHSPKFALNLYIPERIKKWHLLIR
jgi:hypothetical protein